MWILILFSVLIVVNAEPSKQNKISAIDINEPIKVKDHLVHEYVEAKKSYR